jgi:hypothetical protein
MISPQTVDSRIDDGLKDHYAMFYKNVAPNGKLMVFLPGTDAAPWSYQYIMDLGARLGYRVIGLEYPNNDNPYGIWTASHSSDPEGRRKIFHARVTGENLTKLTHVNPGNCIEERLAALLPYLDRTHPDEGWSKFYDGNEVKWDLVCVAGHSQGSGMAAYIAQRHAVDRVALFSGPSLYAGSWVAASGKTPPARIFFAYHKDEVRGDNLLVRGYDALGLQKFGAPVFAESAAPPYNHSHIIRLGLPPAIPDSAALNGRAAHNSTACDRPTPKLADGTPSYSPVWTYLLGGGPQ